MRVYTIRARISKVIITKFVDVKINTNNYSYFLDLGYELEPLGAPKHGHKCQTIRAKVSDLKDGSNKEVQCICDKCGTEFKQRIARNTDVCYPCRRHEALIGNTHGKANKGKTLPHMQGENHPRWNPNKSEYFAYAAKVRAVTYACKDEWMAWENADKIGLCGVEGAYQLDHKVSVAYGFYNHIPAEIIGQLSNLEIITWESNRAKSKSSSIDLWDLLS